MSPVAELARNRYKSGGSDWSEFCDGVRILHRPDQAEKDWGDSLIDFFTWGI